MSLTADQRHTLRLLARVRAMTAEGMGATEIAKALNIGRAPVYRALEGG
jgi:hypothetical protein